MFRLGGDLAKTVYRMILKFSQVRNNMNTRVLNQDIRDIFIIPSKNEFLAIFSKNCEKFRYYASQKKFLKSKKKFKLLDPSSAHAHVYG